MTMSPAEAPAPDPVQTKGSVFRAYLDEIERRGATWRVTRALPPHAREVFERPPVATAWIDGRTIEALFDTLTTVGGDELVRGVARGGMSGSLSPIVKPIFAGLLRVFGATPAAVFARADLTVALTSRGVALSYHPLSERSGAMVVRYEPRPVSASLYVAWTGVGLGVLDLCGARGEAELHDVKEGGREGRFTVRW